MDKIFSYRESYPNLEKALMDGAKIYIFRSGGGLRIVRLVNPKGDLLSYGEYPNLAGALAHAEEDFGLSYVRQYSGDKAKHTHYLTGSYPKPFDPMDIYVYEGNRLDIFYSKKGEDIICTTSPHSELEQGKKILWGTSKSLIGAISLCLVCFKFEDKKEFMKRVGLRFCKNVRCISAHFFLFLLEDNQNFITFNSLK